MSMSAKTEHVELPLGVPTDKFSLYDFNHVNEKLDLLIYALQQADSITAGDVEALKQVDTQYRDRLQSLSDSVLAHGTAIQDIDTMLGSGALETSASAIKPAINELHGETTSLKNKVPKREVIWENNDTSTSFNNKDISLQNLNVYDELEIDLQRNSSSTKTVRVSCTKELNQCDASFTSYGETVSTSAFFYRVITALFDTNIVRISDCMHIPASGNPSPSNTTVIPVKIYGIKY